VTFRIEKALEGPAPLLRLSGRMQSDNLDDLKDELAAYGWTAVLDLDEVTLIDAEVVRLLESLERRGIELRNCPRYVRTWIARVRVEGDPDGTLE
jgi:hypothetical protein